MQNFLARRETEKHLETRRRMRETEGQLAGAEEQLRARQREKQRMTQADERCNQGLFRSLDRTLRAAQAQEAKAQRRLEEARQTRNAARGKIDETEKLIEFCQEHAQHLSSWRDWASARHKRHDFFTGRATAKVESLRKGMAKSRATIPDAVWERMKRDEQQRYDAELRAAQDLNVSEDSPAAPRSAWQRLLQLGR